MAVSYEKHFGDTTPAEPARRFRTRLPIWPRRVNHSQSWRYCTTGRASRPSEGPLGDSGLHHHGVDTVGGLNPGGSYRLALYAPILRLRSFASSSKCRWLRYTARFLKVLLQHFRSSASIYLRSLATPIDVQLNRPGLYLYLCTLDRMSSHRCDCLSSRAGLSRLCFHEKTSFVNTLLSRAAADMLPCPLCR